MINVVMKLFMSEGLVLIYKCLVKWGLCHNMGIISHAFKKLPKLSNI